MISPDVITAALAYAGKGLPVFPCSPRDKRPFTEHGFKDASSDPQIIVSWWEKWPEALIGVPTGQTSGLYALDVDTGHKDGADGFASLSALEAANFPLPETKRTRTPSRGLHYLFKYPAGLELGNSAGKLGPGLDTRGCGGYVIFPPSWTPKGQYAFENPQTPLADIPDWLLQLVTPPPKQERSTPSSQVQVSADHPYARAAIDEQRCCHGALSA